LKEIVTAILDFIFKRRSVVPVDPRLGGVEAPLSPCGTITIHEASSILLDKLDELNDPSAEIFLPDADIKVYRKSDVEKSKGIKEVSALHYVAETHDCDDFAAILFGLFAGLVWTNVHALNWFIDENSTFWWIEPQTGVMSRTLDTWQGYEVRFFVGR